jgi:hypothetical protein
MAKKLTALALAWLLVLASGRAAPALASGAAAKGAQGPEDPRAKISRAGIGEKARVTVWTKDGAKHKGYVAETRGDEFVLRDRKTDAPTILRFGDVTKVDINRGHSTARNTALGVGIGAGAVLVTLAILIASFDD